MNKIKFVLSILIIFSVLTSCDGKPMTKASSNFTIVTSFYPMYLFANSVAANIPGVQVINMSQAQTGCLHDYTLSPADIKTLEKADVFVVNGGGMESFMDKAAKQIPNLKIIEAAKGIDLLKDEITGETNPHVWVSISGAVKEVENIAKGLCAVNPLNADKYKKNADEYIDKLNEQTKKMHDELNNIKNKNIATFHEAFPYFAKEFGLNVTAVLEQEPGSEPSAGEISEIISKIKNTNTKVLFTEPQYSSKAAELIANETGAYIYKLDPVVTGPEKPDKSYYIKVMEQNLKTLIEALNGN